jgi:hypothetical protein
MNKLFAMLIGSFGVFFGLTLTNGNLLVLLVYLSGIIVGGLLVNNKEI